MASWLTEPLYALYTRRLRKRVADGPVPAHVTVFVCSTENLQRRGDEGPHGGARDAGGRVWGPPGVGYTARFPEQAGKPRQREAPQMPGPQPDFTRRHPTHAATRADAAG